MKNILIKDINVVIKSLFKKDYIKTNISLYLRISLDAINYLIDFQEYSIIFV